MRGALRNCREWKVQMIRWSGEGELLDGVMRRLVRESERFGGCYGFVFNGERGGIVRKEEGLRVEEKEKEKKGEVEGPVTDRVADGAADGVAEGVAAGVADGVAFASAVAGDLAEGSSPLDIDQGPTHNDTGTTVVLTPQPDMSSARIVEVTDDMSTGCSDYLSPDEDSPLFPRVRMSVTDADIAKMIGATLTIDPEEERLGVRTRPSCGKMAIGHQGLNSSPKPDYNRSVSPTENNPDGEGSSSAAFNWIGASESKPALAIEDNMAADNMDATMKDVDSDFQDTPIVPGISVTTPGESSTAIQKQTTQLSKSQKKNQARKQKGYKKPKSKKQKTEHPTADDDADDNSATTSAAAIHNEAFFNPRRQPTRPFNLRDRGTHPPFILTPSPDLMPGTFTNAICHYDTIMTHAILTLTFKLTTPTFDHPDTLRNQILTHFEVGLDGVESIIQGQVVINETAAWKTTVREKRVGKLGQRKEGQVGFDRDLCVKQLAAGHGEGMWIFFAIKWRRTVHDCRGGMGGKWVCFGAPVEALKRRQGESESVNLNDFVDDAGERYVTFRRMDIKFSTGGVPCFDLMYGAENNWDNGVWDKVKNAMATSGCLVSFLYEADAEGVQSRDKRYWGILDKPDVEPFFTEGQTKEIPGLLPGFHTQGDRGLGLAEQGGAGGDILAGKGKGKAAIVEDVNDEDAVDEKGKGKAATVKDVNDEDALGGGGETEREEKADETVTTGAKFRAPTSNEMPPPPSPMKWAFPQGTSSEWQLAKKALEESIKKRKAEDEEEALCARLEKKHLEAVRNGRVE